jgi:hypothetical protein
MLKLKDPDPGVVAAVETFAMFSLAWHHPSGSSYWSRVRAGNKSKKSVCSVIDKMKIGP